MMRVPLLKNLQSRRFPTLAHYERAQGTDDEGHRSGAPRPCVCVLRNALSRSGAPYAAPAPRRYLGKSGRSNTPWHTSCENSVQGGILQ